VTRTRAERAGDLLTGWAERLPVRIRKWVPRELAGFAILGGFTLCVDLSLLWALRHWTALPIPVAVSIAYLCAVALNFVLNKVVNFRTHGHVGKEAGRYAAVMVVDFLLTLGVTTGLSALGLDVRLARLIASGCVAIFTWTGARWWVFRPSTATSPDAL
jgi:putative flippase GtrA